MMHFKPTFNMLLIAFLVLISIAVALPTNTPSAAERLVKCLDKIPECDEKHPAHNTNACYTKANDCMPKVDSRADVSPFAAASAATLKTAQVRKTEYTNCIAVAAEKRKQCESPSGPPKLNDCDFNYDNSVAKCHKNIYGNKRDIANLEGVTSVKHDAVVGYKIVKKQNETPIVKWSAIEEGASPVKRDVLNLDIEHREIDIEPGKFNIDVETRANIGNLKSSDLTALTAKYISCLQSCQSKHSKCIADNLLGCTYYFNKCKSSCDKSIGAREVGDLDIEPRTANKVPKCWKVDGGLRRCYES